MKIEYTGRKSDLTAKERIKLGRKFDKIQRILTRRATLEAHVKLSKQRHLCEAEVTLRALRHTLVVVGTGITSFAALNSALDKLEKQALRNKRKIVNRYRSGRQRDQPSAVVEDTLHRTDGGSRAAEAAG